MIFKDCDKACYNIMLLLIQNHWTDSFEILRHETYMSGLCIGSFDIVIWDPDPDLDPF